MTTTGSAAERLDRALHALAAGTTPASATGLAGDAGLRPLLEVAAEIRQHLTVPAVSPRFEARLGTRLAQAAMRPMARRPGRLLVAGAAVSSAAVGVGFTAYAVWRSSRRPGSGRWLLHR